jgi:hypothetical protein
MRALTPGNGAEDCGRKKKCTDKRRRTQKWQIATKFDADRGKKSQPGYAIRASSNKAKGEAEEQRHWSVDRKTKSDGL